VTAKISTMSAAIEDNLDQFIKTIGTFQSMEGSLDTKFYNGLKKIVNDAMKQVSNHTGDYLHNLHEHQPDEDTLQKIIDNVPSSLSYLDNQFDCLPICSAVAYKESVQYVPLLAKEGVKHKVGGDDARGGLLGDDNLLITLAYEHHDDSSSDLLVLDVMKKLRESKLLLREDIENHQLFSHACSRDTSMRFDYFVSWCPEGLRGFVLHTIIYECCFGVESVSMFLETALKLYPNDLGLLFQKDYEYNKGKTACEMLFKEFGKDEIMAAIGELIPFDDPKLPILHHVAEHAPQYMKDFACRYLSAPYLRDSQGRTLHQAALASGNKTFIDDPMFFLEMSDEQVREIDPGSDLYPFMVAASGQTCDLSAVYALMKRNPSLARRNKPQRRKKSKK
jgi:hypothetical protein